MRKRRKLVAKNKGYTAKRLLLLLLALALVAAAAVGVFLLVRERGTFGTLAELPFTADGQWAFTGGGFYYISGDKLCYYDLNDPEKASSLQLSSTDVTLVSSDSITAVYGGAAVHIVGASEMIDAGGQVLSVSCGKRHIAVMRQGSDESVAVLVYDASGTLVDSIESGSALLADCGFGTAGGSDVLWTLSLATSGSIPVSTITTYTYGDSGASMSGVITLQSQLVEDVYFTAGSIFVAGTNHLLRYDKEITSEAYRLLVYGYRPLDFTAGGTKPLFLFASHAAENPATVQLISCADAELADALTRTVNLPEGTHSCFVIGGRFMAVANKTVYTYNASGTLQSTTELEVPCDEAVKLSDSRILFRRGPEMRVMTLR